MHWPLAMRRKYGRSRTDRRAANLANCLTTRAQGARAYNLPPPRPRGRAAEDTQLAKTTKSMQ